jgi:hypothetical protein
MNITLVVIIGLLVMDVVGIAFAFYGLGMAKGWWK